MVIYGTALLAACLLSGMLIGGWLGALTGVDRDLGGIGLSMLLLIASTELLRRLGMLSDGLKTGITWWSGMYIPIVAAMACIQNVKGALSGGPAALLAGAVAVLAGFAVTALLCRSRSSEAQEADRL